ncbi:MAG: hypothetical protein MZW92_16085 [Comamonadaceae bacterium]|nr:hypothetical protein [Comamonadaceae bacterium]
MLLLQRTSAGAGVELHLRQPGDRPWCSASRVGGEVVSGAGVARRRRRLAPAWCCCCWRPTGGAGLRRA